MKLNFSLRGAVKHLKKYSPKKETQETSYVFCWNRGVEFQSIWIKDTFSLFYDERFEKDKYIDICSQFLKIRKSKYLG